MSWVAEVRVTLREGIADPEGQTIAGGLSALGFAEVTGVRTGKLLLVELDAPDREAAAARVDEACRRLLANPVIEAFTFEVRPADATRDAAA